ncbi:MAG: BrnT family toxin [Pseudomonadota bacterium]|nr:BrnT family toxin [Pseudomonadota bacterium]
MAISFDSVKRDWTLTQRRLDFADAERVFGGVKYQFTDERRDYGEVRITSVGLLADRMVIVVWTERDGVRHIISMRKATDREQNRYGQRLG